jgi:endonuclease/exonuclease/phosphatase family metal-dependent hydrolase
MRICAVSLSALGAMRPLIYTRHHRRRVVVAMRRAGAGAGGESMLPTHSGKSGNTGASYLESMMKPLGVAIAVCVLLFVMFKPKSGFDHAFDETNINQFKARLQERGGAQPSAREQAGATSGGAEGGVKAIRLMTFNVANYDDHHQWEIRRKMIAQLIVRENVDVVALQELRHNRNHESEQGSEPKGQLMQLMKELNREFGRPASQGNACRYHLSKSHYYDKRADFWEGKAILICNPDIEVAGVRDLKLKKPQESGDTNMRTAQMAELWVPAPDNPDGVFKIGVVNVHFSYDKYEYASNVKQALQAVQQDWPDLMVRRVTYASLPSCAILLSPPPLPSSPPLLPSPPPLPSLLPSPPLLTSYPLLLSSPPHLPSSRRHFSSAMSISSLTTPPFAPFMIALSMLGGN